VTARALAPLLLAAVALLPQQPFKSGVSTVVVFATVLDASGRIVTDLPRDRFEVYDRGTPQVITSFANGVQPITAVMMLDRSVSMRPNFSLVEQAAAVFVERLLPADKVRIGSFSNRIEVDPAGFTAEKDELRKILQTSLQDPGPTPLWNAVGVGMTALLHVEGRRVVLVFTDGMDQPMNGRTNNLSLRDVAKRAEEEDVMIYAVGLASDPFGTRFDPHARGMGRGGRGGLERPDPGLEKLAAASGGGYFELSSASDLDATFARVADELHHQYLLGFQPAKVDGKSHSLEVRVNGEGLVVRARKSYVSARRD